MTVVVGMIVFMTANVDVEDGLTNGAARVVKHLTTKWKEQNVLVLFGLCLMIHELVGQHERNAERYNSSTQRELTHIFDVQRTFILN